MLYEAYQRLRQPPEVLVVPMLVVAVIVLVVNLTSFRLLTAGSKESRNVEGVFLEVLADEYHVGRGTIRCEPTGHTDREPPV